MIKGLEMHASYVKAKKGSPFYECLLHMREHNKDTWERYQTMLVLTRTSKFDAEQYVLNQYVIELIEDYKKDYDHKKMVNDIKFEW